MTRNTFPTNSYDSWEAGVSSATPHNLDLDSNLNRLLVAYSLKVKSTAKFSSMQIDASKGNYPKLHRIESNRPVWMHFGKASSSLIFMTSLLITHGGFSMNHYSATVFIENNESTCQGSAENDHLATYCTTVATRTVLLE